MASTAKRYRFHLHPYRLLLLHSNPFLEEPQSLPPLPLWVPPQSQLPRRRRRDNSGSFSKRRMKGAGLPRWMAFFFTVEDFDAVLDKYDFTSGIGAKVKGTVFMNDMNGALVDITAKSSAYLPVEEACIHKIKHVEDAGIYPGLTEEFIIIGENSKDDSLILSLRSIQYDLAWERCRQLQAEDVVVKGKIDVDIGSSTVANGVLGLLFCAITSLVVDMAFLVQGNTIDELPERLIGAVRISHIELSSAIILFCTYTGKEKHEKQVGRPAADSLHLHKLYAYYLAFGGGSRACPGKEMGMAKISFFLYHFVTKYRWEEIGGEKFLKFPRVEAPNGLHIRVYDQTDR